MKVAVSASGNDLDAAIDPRFGRCAYFVIVDIDDMSFDFFDNESISLGGGAGIQAAQFVASKDVKVVITGNVGPNAVRTLAAAGVEVIIGQTGTVKQAIDDYKTGKLESTVEPNVADHFGMGGTPAGGGMGRGMGGGMGRGMGATGGAYANQPGPTSSSRQQELNLLKDQAIELREQIKAVESSIKDLEKK